MYKLSLLSIYKCIYLILCYCRWKRWSDETWASNCFNTT